MTTIRVTASGIRNRTHVLYLASWLREASGRHGVPITLIEINGQGVLAAEFGRADSLVSALPGVQLVGRHTDSKGLHYFVSIGSPATKAWARFRLSPSAWPLRTVVVDEGLGSYGDISTRRSAMSREGTNEPRTTIRVLAGALARRLLPDERWRMYELDGQTWKLNQHVAAEFQRTSQQVVPTGRTIFITQPWIDFGLVEEREQMGHLESVAEALERSGEHIAIKPHPAEPISRYSQFEVIDSRLPAELDPEVLGARFVLGETSTALLNLAAIHGVPVARVIGPATLNPSIAMSRSQALLFEQFVPHTVTTEHLGATVKALGR